MAFFKFPRPDRKRGKDGASVAARGESIEAMRRRAKHRLLGAAVLVLIGVVGFPLVFDTQPRPIAVDIPIEIPGTNQVKPLALPAPTATAPTNGAAAAANPAAPMAAASGPVAQVPVPASLGSKEEIVNETPARVPETKTKTKTANALPAPAAPAEPKPAVTPRPEPKAAAQAADAARIEALLNGKTTPPSASESGRFVVQVGAFADAAKAREARQKVEKAGLKTYTQVVDTKDGKRTRVRVGPFASRAEADKAAGKIRGLALPAAILSL